MSDALDAYIRTAKQAGCPPGQIGNFLRAGIVLQERQLTASAAARLCDLPGGPTEVGYGGARGGGKSHWGLAQVGADDCQRYPGLKVLVLRKVGKALKEGVTDLLRRVLGGIAYRWVASEQTVYFANGSRMLLGHFQKESDIDAYLGLEYDVILIEEATTLSATKRRAILTCLRTSKPNWRPRCYSTTNPGGLGHAWYKEAMVDPHRAGQGYRPLREQSGPTRYVPATVDDNAFLNGEYRDELEKLNGWQLRAWRFGDWDIAAGQFFTNFRRDIHVCTPFAIPADWRVWAAMDYGFQHPQAMYLLAKDGDGMVYIVAEHFARHRLIPDHVADFTRLLDRHGVSIGRLSSFVAGSDAFSKREDGATIADKYAKLGFHLTFANTDRVNGAAEFLARFGDVEREIAPRIKIFESCPALITCLPALQHDQARPEDVKKVDADDDGKGGDDAYDGARYGIMEDYNAAADILDFYKQRAGELAQAA